MSGDSHMTAGGQRVNRPTQAGQGQSTSQAPPTKAQSQGITMPRQHSEESYDLQEMLKIWDNSNKSPFGEGTLV